MALDSLARAGGRRPTLLRVSACVAVRTAQGPPRGVQTSAKARAASMGMQDNSGMGAPSSHSPYQQLPSMMVQNMGWQQHWSEEDGRPFWTSPDGESTWDKPSHYA